MLWKIGTFTNPILIFLLFLFPFILRCTIQNWRALRALVGLHKDQLTVGQRIRHSMLCVKKSRTCLQHLPRGHPPSPTSPRSRSRTLRSPQTSSAVSSMQTSTLSYGWRWTRPRRWSPSLYLWAALSSFTTPDFSSPSIQSLHRTYWR